jgi:1-acyl-sn-glycerol-3-phosphate acyltransferase
MTWGADVPPPPARLRAGDWPLIVLRGGLLATLLLAGLLLLLVLRLPERAMFGLRRPVTPWLVQGVCRLALRIIGLRVQPQGQAMTSRGALVANHASWLDIFVLNAHARVFFVSKSEVARWPGIGWLARATGTVFIQRERSQAAVQTLLFQARLRAGHRLLFFPEGTSSDGQRILPFKPALFEAFLAPDLAQILHLQPVSVTYHAPPGYDPRHFAWWGKMDFGPHLLHVLATRRSGHVRLVFHPAIPATSKGERKALAAECEASVRSGFAIQAASESL